MTDYHSHILPGIDDGSRNVEQSLELLDMLARQGAGVSVATPHFYADRDTPAGFLAKRNAAYEELISHPDFPGTDIRLGAEVYYFSGISRMKELRDLRIEGTKLLLIEMPFTKWSDYVMRELYEIASSGYFVPVIAHLERYLEYQGRGIAEELIDRGMLIQCNTSFFADRSTGRKALKMLKKGLIHMIGTDCHNPDSRPPRLDEFREAVTGKLGPGFYERFEEENDSLLEEFV